MLFLPRMLPMSVFSTSKSLCFPEPCSNALFFLACDSPPPPELLSSISCYHWLSMLQALRHVIASPNKKPEAHVGQNSWHVAWSIKCAEQRAEYHNCHVIFCGTGGRGGRSSHGLKWYRKWDCDHCGWRAWGRIALYGLFLCHCDQTPWPRQLMDRDRVLLEFTVLESTVARAASLQVADRLTSWKLSHPLEERRNRDIEPKIGSQWSTSFSKMALLKLPQTVPPSGGQVIKASSLLARAGAGGGVFLIQTTTCLNHPETLVKSEYLQHILATKSGSTRQRGDATGMWGIFFSSLVLSSIFNSVYFFSSQGY